MTNYSYVGKLLRTVGTTLTKYGPAIFTCAASIYSVKHEDEKTRKVAKEVAELVMDELAKKGALK